MRNQTSEKIRHFKDFKDAFIKLSYGHELLDYRFEKRMRVDRKTFTNNEKASYPGKFTLPNIKKCH